MEYGAPPPDPTAGIGGYKSSMPHHKSPSGFSEDSMPDGSIDDAMRVAPVGYNNLILPSGIPGRYDSIPQNTELPQYVMSSEDQITSQHDSNQESEDESDLEKPLGKDWPPSEEDDEMEGSEEDEEDGSYDEDEGAIDDDEEENEKCLMLDDAQRMAISGEEHQQYLQKGIVREGWQPHGPRNEDFEIWGSESEGTVTNVEQCTTDTSETESVEEEHMSGRGEEEDEDDDIKQNLSSSLKSEKTLSPDSVLCFDEYGNLTTYRPEVPHLPPSPLPPSPPPPAPAPSPPKIDFEKITNQEFFDATETLEAEMNDSLMPKKVEQNDETIVNGARNIEIKSLKSRQTKSVENSEGNNVSDQELKQAFKEEFLTAATSRYGRARKRKTEDGFFFGTLNFNELRKITSTTSPKKCKGITGNVKGGSPELKAKISKIENKVKSKLDEVMEDVIRNGPINSAGVNVESDANIFRNSREVSVAKGDNDIVQNSLSGDVKEPLTPDMYISQRGKVAPKEEKVLLKNDCKILSLKGKSLQKKEVKSEPSLITKPLKLFETEEELKTSLEDDVKKIKQAEKRKRLSLPRRNELSLLRENEALVNVTSDRMLRRRSDVWKIKNSLQPKKNANSRRQSTRNSINGDKEIIDVPLDPESLPLAKSNLLVNSKIKTGGEKQELAPTHSDTISPAHLSEKETSLELPMDPPTRRLRSSCDPSIVPQKLESGIFNSDPQRLEPGIPTSTQRGKSSASPDQLKPSANPAQLKPSTTPAQLKPSAIPGHLKPTAFPSQLKLSASRGHLKHSASPGKLKPGSPGQLKPTSPAQVKPKEPVVIATCPPDLHQSQWKSPVSITKDDESGSMTKSGRTVRRPQLMDISAEDKKRKMEQMKSKEMLSSSIVGELPVEFDLSVLEKEHPCKHMVGDLVWVLLKGYPLWPAMISYQPENGEFTKLSVKQSWQGKLSCVRFYFVQFFNDNSQTSWIGPNSALPFEGYTKLGEYLHDLKSRVKNMKSSQRIHAEGMLKTLVHIKKISKSVPIAQNGGRWMAAIEEGEIAMAMDRYERLQKYTLKQLEEEKKEPPRNTIEKATVKKSPPCRLSLGKKRKIGRPSKVSLKEKILLGVKPSDDGLSTDGEFSGFDENYSSDENRNVSNLISDISSGNKQSFAQYASKHLQRFILENPSISETAARTKLRWRWKKLVNSQAAKRKFKLKNEAKVQPILESSSLKRKHQNSVESVCVSDDSDVVVAKRKRYDESRDCQKGVYKVVRNEKVCQMCESASTESGADMVRCKGMCYGVFHLSCVGLGVIPKTDFKCIACQTGDHLCFICKKTAGTRQRCTIPFCGKFYHEECVQNWPQVSKNRHQEKFVCPRHVCHMCAANADDMNDPVARNPQFTRCLRCPTTYHTGEECIAAGSEEVSLNHHICTKHLKLPKNNMHHVNVSWCFCCSKGGSLLLCDQCPAAFHADCMKITAPEGSYVCEDCENGKFPVYGDVVWVKLGLYRWWPGQVLHPRYIPDNIENLPHQQGMFCVHFFGSNDYYWVTRGRAFHYQEGDKGSKAASSKTLEMQFQRAIQEALEAYREQRQRKAQLEVVRSGKGKLKPPPYVRIDSNRPVGNVRLNKLDLASVNRCECDPFSENPCESDEKCLNRMLMFECVREVCGAGDRCGNQRFQKRLYANVCSFRTEERGWGLKTLNDIKKGDFVIEYVGELIDDEEFHRRIEEMHKVKEENYYFLTIDKDIMIDAGPKGNLARFMNHSCEPNCETQKWTVGGDTRVGLFALYNIPAGSELTFNYNLQCVGTEKKKCNCGAANCSGYIGAKVQKQSDSSGPKREKIAKKKRKRKRQVKISEDECYRCGGAGDLILCDVTDCPKSYHLLCLGLDKLPKGKWICPWHHCDECGQRSIRPNRCDYCPNSFCRTHVPGNLQHVVGVGNVCQDHDTEDIETLRGQMEAKAVVEEDMAFDNQDSVDANRQCAMGSEQDEMLSNLSCDMPSYANDADVDSSSCIYKNSLTTLVCESFQEQDQMVTSKSQNKSVIIPLRMKENRCRPKKIDRVSEGHENNSSIINVNNDACFLSVNSNKSYAKAVVTPKNGIRNRRSAPENVAKAVNVV